MEVVEWKKLGPLKRVRTLYESDSTELICYTDSDRKRYFSHRNQPRKVTYNRIIIDGVHTGLIFKDHEVFWRKVGQDTIVKVSLVTAKAITIEKEVVLDSENALDRALMSMDAIDVLGEELDDEN